MKYEITCWKTSMFRQTLTQCLSEGNPCGNHDLVSLLHDSKTKYPPSPRVSSPLTENDSTLSKNISISRGHAARISMSRSTFKMVNRGANVFRGAKMTL